MATAGTSDATREVMPPTSAPPRPRPRLTMPGPSALAALRLLGGLVIAVVLWSLIAASGLLPDGSIPTPGDVVSDLVGNPSYYLDNAAPTTVTALEGFAIALVVSLALGMLGSLTGLLERSVSRIALAIYCLPLPALLPIIASLVGPGQATRVTMAVLFSFFPILIGTLTGLRATPTDMAAIVRCAGGGRAKVLVKVGLRSALPTIVAGMRIAGPGALLGALVAEFSGAEKGLGVALVVSQQKLQVTQTWGLALVATVIGAIFYGVVTALGRWWHVEPVDAQTAPRAEEASGLVRRVIELLTPPIALLVLWLALAHLGGASPLVFKTPSDVLDYLTSAPTAAEHRSTLTADWLTTMYDTGLIFVVGMLAAVVAGCVLVSLPGLLRLVLPLLIASQCVPQIAFVPLLVAICGRGTAFIVVTGLLVVFFPAMIVVTTALEERSRSSLDLIRVYSGGRWAVLRFARLPGAVPGILNAARISIPLSLFGALVAEWLVTGEGIAQAMTTATTTFDYTRLWADVAATTVTVYVLYAAVGLLHDRSRARFH